MIHSAERGARRAGRVARVWLARAAIAGCLSATPRALAAQLPSPPRGATLSEVLGYALRASADLALARFAMDSARAEQRVAHALPNPFYVANPNTPYQYGATLPLDIGPQRAFRTRAGDRGAAAARLDARDAVRQVTFGIRRVFYDLLLADTLVALATARSTVIAQVLAADSARLRAGDIPERNVFRSESELARADADLARARITVEITRLALQGLMGTPTPDTGFTVSGDLRYRQFDIPADSDLIAVALTARPDLAATEMRIDQSTAQSRLAASYLVPIPQVSYIRQFTAPFESGHFYSFGVSIEVPLVNFYRGQRERARAGLGAARAVERRTREQVQRDVMAAASDARAERALVERFEAGLLAKSDAAVEAARYAYGRGATSLLDVLDALRAQQDLRTDYYTALHDYWGALFALERAVGAALITGARP